jgi:hypothetical protein
MSFKQLSKSDKYNVKKEGDEFGDVLSDFYKKCGVNIAILKLSLTFVTAFNEKHYTISEFSFR